MIRSRKFNDVILVGGICVDKFVVRLVGNKFRGIACHFLCFAFTLLVYLISAYAVKAFLVDVCGKL